MSSRPSALVVRILAYWPPWYLFPFSPFILRARFGVCFFWVPFFLHGFLLGGSVFLCDVSREIRKRDISLEADILGILISFTVLLFFTLFSWLVQLFSLAKKYDGAIGFLRWRWIQSVDFIWTYGMRYCRQMRTALKGWMEMYAKDSPRYALAISVAKYILLG